MPSITESIDFVVKEVRAMLASNSVNKVAIIGRKRGQIIPYQIMFASHNIPFYAAEDLQVFLSNAFGELKELLGIKARSGVGPIPGIDPINDLMKLVNKVKRYPLSKKDGGELLKHLHSKRPKTLDACVASLRSYTGPLKGNNENAARSNSFADAVLELLKAKKVSEAIKAISDNFDGLQKDYGKSLEDIFYSDPPFLHLAEFAERYGTDYAAFYEDIDKAIATLARVPSDEDEAAEREPEWKLPLHLMTALRAKGKEFDAVIILDVNQGIWPSKLATTEEQLEQERRIFYVAFTRARKRLTLLVCDSILGCAAVPSPYLAEMGLVAKPLVGLAR
jgi:DNA helicase-2/ATP-dependent DNA helicase PcrA